jgi:hypothetical protein
LTDQRPNAAALEARVGHPGERWQILRDRVQDQAVTKFTDVEADWLGLMWSIDAFRTEGIAPRLMGREDIDDVLRLAAVYRFKGNWFATLIALLLQNRTHQPISPRTKVKGFSQNHQIDVAWPVREEDPLVCVETKVSGASATPSVTARGALADFSNRRKELKFAATDLKLNRRQQETQIEHWGVWRENAPPKTYFLWAARLRTTGRQPELLSKLIDEASALRDTYLDGAGLVAWRARDDGSGYQGLKLPANARVTELDDTLYRIASEISRLTGPGGKPPDPEIPKYRDVDVENLAPDATVEAPK